jgi:integrase
MRIKLTDKFVQNVKPEKGEQIDIWDTTVPAFGLRVGALKKTFVVMVRVGGVKRRIALGDYPTLKLGAARTKAGEAMEAAERGSDPATTVRRAPSPRHGKTIGELVPEFIEKHCKKKNRDWKKQESIFNLDVLPAWEKRLATSIKRSDCIELIDTAARRTSDVTANRVRAHVSRFFNWLIERDTPGIEANPMTRVPPPGDETRRQRVLSDDELALCWRCWDAGTPGAPFGTIFKLLAVTLQRRDEVGYMRWPDIDLDNGVWVVPAEHAKNKLPLAVPLSTLAVKILRAHPVADPAGYVFPSANGSGNPASGYSKAKLQLDIAITAALAATTSALPGRTLTPSARTGTVVLTAAGHRPFSSADEKRVIGIRHGGEWGFAQLEDIRSPAEATADVLRPFATSEPSDGWQLGFEPWWLHDLRRVGRTGLSRLGVSSFIGERVIGHISGEAQSVRATYDVYSFFNEKRDALERWSGHLEALIAGSATSVIPMRISS